MKTAPSKETPIACTLEAGAFEERLSWIAELNRAALLDARREGRRLILTYRRDHAERVREMVRREGRCCGFLGFDLTEAHDDVRLVIEAPEDLCDSLDVIFDQFLPASARSEGCACASQPEGERQ